MIRKFILALSFLVGIVANAQIGVGLRDTRFVNVNYTLKDNFFFELEQSIFSDYLKFQTIRAYAGYQNLVANVLQYKAYAYYGMAWNNNYRNFGAKLGLDYNIKRVGFYGIANPHYDSTFGFDFFYRIGASVRVFNDIKVKCDYNTIPVYRDGEKRIRFGFDFAVKNLSVEPLLSFPLDGEHKVKSWRVLVSFNYIFKQ